MKKKLFSILIISLLSIHCSDKITTEDDLTSPQVQQNRLAKFSELQKQVFNKSCATSGCHAGSNPQANLNLSEGNAFSNLVNVQSILNPNLKRVQPGNADASYLVKVLTWETDIKMPLGGQKLSQNIIDSIKVWINKGAPND